MHLINCALAFDLCCLICVCVGGFGNSIVENPLDMSVASHNVPNPNGIGSPIDPGAIANNNFEIKTGLMNMLGNDAFHGNQSEDPRDHLVSFQGTCSTMKRNGVSDETIKLMLFPYSLKGKARTWLYSHPAGHFTTWSDLSKAFLSKYYPPSKTSRVRSEIQSFEQGEFESLNEAWERYKDLQR